MQMVAQVLPYAGQLVHDVDARSLQHRALTDTRELEQPGRDQRPRRQDDLAARAGLQAAVFIPEGQVALGKLSQALDYGALTVQIGLNLKKASPHERTFIAGYTNGYIYYTPTARQLDNVGGAQEDSDCLLAPAWQAIFENRVAQMLRVPGQEMAKTVLVRTGHGHVLAVLPATHQVDLDRLRRDLKEDQADLATENDMERIFPDCERGAMPPFGSLYQLPTLVDESLARDEERVRKRWRVSCEEQTA